MFLKKLVLYSLLTTFIAPLHYFQKIELQTQLQYICSGHDTTASAISWALHTLAEHPEIQLRCQEEVDEVVAGKDSPVIEWWDNF